MPRKPEPADPLADLREPDAPAALPDPDPAPEPDPATGLLEYESLEHLDQLWHQDAAQRIVTGWHADETAASYLHHGGLCGCRYLAAAALVTVHGIPSVADPVEADEL